MKKKIAVCMSHPIQYQVPFLRKIASKEEVDLMVYFFWNFGVAKTKDPEFGKNIQWDIPILEGYKYKFIKNYAKNPSSNFFGQLNWGIIPELLRCRYEAVLLFGWNSLPNWIVFFLAPLIGTKVILMGESPLSQELRKRKSVLFLKKIILKIIFFLSSAILYIGKENKKFYEFYGVQKKKLFFMPYAVENERFIREKIKLEGQREIFRKKLGLTNETSVVLFVGKLFSKKRPMDLLQAYAAIEEENKALLFVGDGELRSNLEEYVRESNIKNVYFVGFKNQTELAEYYIISDIFVLPSDIGETWGLVVNEAMCFGLPVIVSDIVGCGSDLVEVDKNGFIFPCGNIKELTKYISILISDKEKRESFGKKSFEIISRYTQDKDVETFLSVLNTIIKK